MQSPSSKMTPLEIPTSLKDQAYRRIKEAILSLELKPGEPLVESDLAERLGISKTPVRDALTELRREGLVTKIPYSGTFVSEITTRDVAEIIEIRAVLEGLAARLATPVLTEAELERLDALINSELDSIAQGNMERASQLNGEFHDIIIHKVGNQRLVSILENIEDQMRRVRALSSQLRGRLRKSAEEHRTVLAALCERDPDRVEQMFRVHMLSVLEDLSDGAGQSDGETEKAALPMYFPAL
jgi:DNA-binding GntR family transcriptional regulator